MLRIKFSVYQLFCLFLIIIASSAQAQDMTLSELRKAGDDAKAQVMTGHLIYTEELRDNRPLTNTVNMNDLSTKQRMSHKNINQNIDILIDKKGKNLNILERDLRNIEKVMKDFNLPDYTRPAVSHSKKALFKDNIEMQLLDDVSPGQKPQIGLVEPPIENATFDLLSLGVVDEAYLSDSGNPVLSTIEKDGKKLLRVMITSTKGDINSIMTIDCDPQIGYKFCRIELKFNERLVGETIADHYTNINGIPYPFVFIYRNYDKNGAINVEQIKAFEKVELNIPVTKEDFKIMIPDGVLVDDDVIYKAQYEVKDGGLMGIDDILAIGAARTVNN